MPITIDPSKKPTTIEEWIGTPSDLAGYAIVVLLIKAGWNFVDRVLPVVKRAVGTTIIQETGEGSVQSR